MWQKTYFFLLITARFPISFIGICCILLRTFSACLISFFTLIYFIPLFLLLNVLYLFLKFLLSFSRLPLIIFLPLHPFYRKFLFLLSFFLFLNNTFHTSLTITYRFSIFSSLSLVPSLCLPFTHSHFFVLLFTSFFLSLSLSY